MTYTEQAWTHNFKFGKFAIMGLLFAFVGPCLSMKRKQQHGHLVIIHHIIVLIALSVPISLCLTLFQPPFNVS